jgi:hypothetical protein
MNTWSWDDLDQPPSNDNNKRWGFIIEFDGPFSAEDKPPAGEVKSQKQQPKQAADLAAQRKAEIARMLQKKRLKRQAAAQSQAQAAEQQFKAQDYYIKNVLPLEIQYQKNIADQAMKMRVIQALEGIDRSTRSISETIRKK